MLDQPPRPVGRPYVSLRFAAHVLGLPYAGFRKAVANGVLPSIPWGNRRRVRIDQIKEKLDQLSAKPLATQVDGRPVQLDLFSSRNGDGGHDG